MSAEAKHSYGWSCTLLILGLIALYGGTPWLLFVIPAAVVLWLSCPAESATRAMDAEWRIMVKPSLEPGPLRSEGGEIF